MYYIEWIPAGGGTQPDDPDAQEPDAIAIKNGEEAASALDMKTGDTVTLTATATKEGSADNVKQAVTWSSDDESVATVVNGKVTAKGAGTATITAASASTTTVTATVTVTVTASPIVHIFDPELDTVLSKVDKTGVTYSSGQTSNNITFTSSSGAWGSSDSAKCSIKGTAGGKINVIKMNTAGRTFSVTAPGDGKLTLVLGSAAGTNVPTDVPVSVDGEQMASSPFADATAGVCPITFDVEKGKVYQVGNGTDGSYNIFIHALVWMPAGSEECAHASTTDGTAVAATCQNGGYTPFYCNNITCFVEGEKNVTTKLDHHYTNGVCDNQVNSKACGDIQLSYFKGLLDAETAKPDAIAQADVIDEDTLKAAAKTWAEGVVNNTGVTVAVAKTSYTAATEGDEANANGTNGAYKFTVTLTTKADATGVTSAEKELVVTATAHGAEVKKDALNTAITAAEAKAEAITVDTDAANVDEGAKWITQAALDAYKTAIAAAKAVAGNADATQAEVNTAVTTLATATTAFEAAQQVGTKADPNTFDPTKLAGATDKTAVTKSEMKAPFGVVGTVMKRGSANGITSIETDKPGSDDSSPNAFTVTVPEGKVCDLMIKASSNGGSNTSDFVLKLNGAGANIANAEGKTSVEGASDSAVELHWTGLEAGTYYFFTPAGTSNNNRGIRVLSAHVDFKDAQGGDTPTPPTPGQVVVTSVTLHTHEEIELTVGETTDPLEVDVAVTPDTAENKAVTWTSSDTAVATVSADGAVTAVAAGTATITVKSVKDTTKSDTCTVKVEAVSSEPTVTTTAHTFESKTLTKNTTAGADGTEPYAADSYFTVMPGAKGKYDESKKQWKEDDFGENAYDPSGDGAQTNVVRFSMGSASKADGPAIKFTTTSDNAKVQIWWVQGGGDTEDKDGSGNKLGTFTDVGIRQIALLKTDATLVAKSELAHTSNTPSGTDAGRIKANDPEYTELTAPTAGTYMVGSLDGSNYIFKIVVTETTISGGTVPVDSVTLDKTSLSLAVGGTSKLTATVNPANATNKAVTWNSSNTAVATVADDGTVTAVAAGTANITVTTKNGKKATCAVTVTAGGSGTDTPGSSGSSGGGDMIPTTSGGGATVTNPDGSKTNTKTNSSTGAVTETTTYPNGDKTVVVTEKDGTKTETVTKKDGTKTETVTKPDGSTTVAATDAKGIKTEVATSASGEVSAKVSLPKSVDKTVVTIPVKDVTDGTVAVIVNANGTEQVIKTSMAGENGLELLVDKNVSVKIKDNAKKFDDIEDGYWAKGAVDFASSREIFKGVTETTFAPTELVNRGMMATVLYRLADAKPEGENVFFDVADGDWYTDAVAWANHSGVVTGYADGTFGPADAVTREQMAAMLFRFAKVTGMDVTVKGDVSKFSDGADVSSWASEAMAWAVGVGLVNGVGDPAQGTILAPAKTASRAEVATLMQRMVKLMMQ